MHWNYGPMGLSWFDWVLLVIVILVFFGGLTAVVLTATHRTHTTASPPRDDSRAPLDILAVRFARGEIDEEEYRARRDALSEIK
ncbi:SHOCT domain-containing protein [Kibdelosporangium philippinense]|uniref:SHOCT domain-containing protein n=1 Tax=Kibdelosporangium philippinense TaxID=211113 RepID=A0ABS8ZC62_9PSEU|nr:SHOCT domain-containing protein [Kibdelosporangium philippinense]MCE7004618.1 SHOCT domain-containing protein [Kibdelosporangium philippinense]